MVVRTVLIILILSIGVFNYSERSLEAQVNRTEILGDVTSLTNNGYKLSLVDETKKLEPMTIILNFRNEEKLKELLKEQQNPTSLEYQKWLSPEEFGEKFGRSEQEYQEVIGWLKSTGLEVVREWQNRLQITVQGNRDSVKKAFGVEVNLYNISNQVGYAADGIPSIPAQFTKIVTGVSGLHNFERFRRISERDSIVIDKEIGNMFTPNAYAKVYNVEPLLKKGIDGRGVKIAIALRSDFNIDDVTKFSENFGLREKVVEKYFPFGSVQNYGGGEELESVVDCEWARAAAPGADISAVIGSDIDRALQGIVNDKFDHKVVSISFAGCEYAYRKVDVELIDKLYIQAAAQGQTIFIAAGNNGVSQCMSLTTGSDDDKRPSVNLFASSEYVTAVGGTNMEMRYDGDGNATGYISETAWDKSNGGDSIYHKKPSYQAGIGVPDNQWRNVPDVALLAGSPGYVYMFRNGLGLIGGTSIATPCWAGMCALINQAKNTNGLGSINAELYRLGNAQARGEATGIFHDILIGNNSQNDVQGFEAGKGYDRITGWGSFDGEGLINNFKELVSKDNILPQVKLLAPKDGAQIVRGEAVRIIWESSDDSEIMSHDIALYKDEGKVFDKTIVAGLQKNTTMYDWSIPVETELNNKIRIVVRAIDTSFNIGTTSVDVAIVSDKKPPFLRIVDPVDGAKTKDLFKVTWLAWDNVGIASQKIYVHRGRDKDQGEIIQNLTSDIRTYTIPFVGSRNSDLSTPIKFRIEIKDSDGNEAVAESQYELFSDTSKYPWFSQLRVVLKDDPKLNVINAGDAIPITWKFIDKPQIEISDINYDIFLGTEKNSIYGFPAPLATGLSGEISSFLWKVTDTIASAKDASIYITATSKNDKNTKQGSGESKSFKINSSFKGPSVEILKPSIKDTLQAGTPFTIEWKSSSDNEIVRQDIFLRTYPDMTSIATGLSGEVHSFEWIPSSALRSAYTAIGVLAIDSAGNRFSDYSEQFGLNADSEPPKVEILSPKPGDEFKSGSKVTITWKSTDEHTVVNQDIYLEVSNQFSESLAINLPRNVQSFTWDIPEVFQSKKVKLRVSSRDQAYNYGYGSVEFSVKSDFKPPVVELFAPNGGEKLSVGKNFLIQWKSSEYFMNPVVQYDLLLSLDGGKSFPEILASGLSEKANSFMYNVPSDQPKTKTAVVKIVATDINSNKVEDISDKHFKIK